MFILNQWQMTMNCTADEAKLKELVDGLRQHVRLAHYAPEERLEAVRLALDQVKDQLDEDEVNAYHHAKLVQQTPLFITRACT